VENAYKQKKGNPCYAVIAQIKQGAKMESPAKDCIKRPQETQILSKSAILSPFLIST
jgi:hypothetical protein